MKDIQLIENIERLKNQYKMSDELINSIIYNHDTYHPIAISTMLADIDDIEEVERVLHIIDTMHRNLGIDYETIASFVDLNKKEFEEFMKNPNTLNENKKFKLAVRVMFLHFVLKEKYETNMKLS